MKIAFLNLYSGLVERGAETFVHELAQRLSTEFGHEVTVFQGGRARGNEDYLVREVVVGLDWSRRDTSTSLLARVFLDYWRLRAALFGLKVLPELWRKKYDVVIPVNGGWQVTLVRLATWLYGGKVVVSGQSGVGWDDRNNLWNFPNAFVGVSTKARNWAKKVNRFVRVEYIPNGVDVKKFTSVGKKFKVRLKGSIVLCVGALTRAKRIDLAIRAVSRLKGVSLVVVGDGDLRGEIAGLGRKLLGDRFVLRKVPRVKMPQVYRIAQVFTIPSEGWHSFEIVLVEAMAANVPVVANKDEVREEIVGEAGLLVDPENLEGYARALERALEINWGEKPRRQAEKFAWDKIARQYDELFKELVG